MVIVINEKSVRLLYLLICILFVVPLRQHILFLRLHDGISPADKSSSHLDDCFLGGHALAAVGIVTSQLIVSVNSYPARLYNKLAELSIASEGLHSIDFLLAGVVACRDKPEDSDKLAFVGETHEIVVKLRQHRHSSYQPESWHG